MVRFFNGLHLDPGAPRTASGYFKIA